MKEDLDEVDEGHVPTVGRQYSDHGDALAHRAVADSGEPSSDGAKKKA